jgi:hypothetical protein
MRELISLIFLLPTNLNTSNQLFTMKKLFIVLLIVLLLFSPVLAAYPDGFTPVVNYTGDYSTPNDIIHYNVSYSQNDSGATAFPFWFFIAITGLLMLFGSRALDLKKGGELLGLVAPIALLIAMIQSFKIDMVSGYGVASQIAYNGTSGISIKIPPDPNIGEYIMLEHHIIYSETLLAVFFAILFVISIFNIYQLYVNAKTLQEDYRPGNNI